MKPDDLTLRPPAGGRAGGVCSPCWSVCVSGGWHVRTATFCDPHLGMTGETFLKKG